MKPWLVHASVVLIEMTPRVARLVIITDKGGKSRGSYLVLDRNGEKPCPELGNRWRFSVNPPRAFVDRRILEIFLDDSGKVIKKWVNIRPIPKVEGWFESVWRDFREDRIVTEEE